MYKIYKLLDVVIITPLINVSVKLGENFARILIIQSSTLYIDGSTIRTLKTTNIKLVTELVTDLENNIYNTILLTEFYVNYFSNA